MVGGISWGSMEIWEVGQVLADVYDGKMFGEHLCY